jgi:hypothetical protein
MGVAFYAFLICNLFWIPWDRVSQRLLPSYRKLGPLHKQLPLHKHPVPLNGEQSKQDKVSR